MGNRSTRRKPAPVTLCPPQTPLAARTRTRAAAVGSQRLTAELRHGDLSTLHTDIIQNNTTLSVELFALTINNSAYVFAHSH
jgi:hypothetical protein